MAEKYLSYVLACAVLLGLFAFGWLIVRAFRTRLAWGFACLFFPPVTVVFAIRHFQRLTGPLISLAVAVLLLGGTISAGVFLTGVPDFGVRERLVDGERHITLTGSNCSDYAILRKKLDTVVLQMANPDVTDETLGHLDGMSRLRELDLNDTQVGDAALPLLGRLPSLQILRLRKTQISDQGFREHLAGKDSLLELDLRLTDVTSRTLREWKAKNKEQRKYLR